MQSGILSVDIGTSSLKAAIIDENGTVLHFVRFFFPKQVAASDWIRAFFSVWKELTADYRVCGICISGNGPSLVAVSSQAKSTAGMHHASCAVFDEVIKEAEKDVLFLWNEQSDTGAGHNRSGASLFLPRIAAFHRKYPSVLARTDYLFSGPEYLLFILTGEAVTALPDERYEAVYWSSEELNKDAYTAVQEAVPSLRKLLPPFTAAGTEVGRFCGIPVIAGVPDFIAALIGTGTLTEGTACDRAGSSEGLNICTAVPFKAANILLLPSVMPGLWNASFLLPVSGSSFSAFLSTGGFSVSDYAQCMEMIAAEPFRALNDYPATFAGQGRVLVEELGFRIRYGCDLLEEAAGIHPVYTLSGGQARNARWCQMKADITGRTFALPHCADAELLGNAALAFYGLEKHREGRQRSALSAWVRQLIRIERYYEPDSVLSGRYAEKYAGQAVTRG
ncbi:MAG: FGGY-family carbohydrate kinase [Treponema sp.]